MVLRMPRPYKHRRTGVYYFRRIVPEAMRPLVGKAEVHISLRTKDPREAARRWSDAAKQVDAEWESLRREPSPADLARQFVQQLDDPASLAQDIHEANLAAEGVLDERELPEDWEPTPTPKAQKAISRAIERQGLTSWLEASSREGPDPRPAYEIAGGRGEHPRRAVPCITT
jgi:hypothetical protein